MSLALKSTPTGRRGGQYGNDNAAKNHYGESASKAVIDFENEHAAAKEENALLVNAAGTPFLKKRGNAGRMEFGQSEWQAASKNKPFVMTHNHPYDQNNASGLSKEDLKSGYTMGAHEVRAVDRWYVHSFTFPDMPYHQFETHAIKASQETAKNLDRAVRRGTLTNDQADLVFGMERAKLLAKRVGGRYTVYNRRTGLASENVDEYGK